MKIQFSPILEYQQYIIDKLKENCQINNLTRVIVRDNGFKDTKVAANTIRTLKQFNISKARSML